MQDVLRKVIWACLLIIPFVALYVASGHSLDIVNWGTSGLYFPFISGKNLLFRFLIEIAFFGWILLAITNPSYRLSLRKSPILLAYSVFMVVLFLADMFGVNPFKSFWSNFERMEGFAGHLHLFAYFIVLSAMLRSLEEYRKLFKVFIASNIAVLIFAYGQLLGAKGYIFSQLFPGIASFFSSIFPIHMSENRLDATLGNSAYFAVYCLMFAFILALVWSQEKEPKKHVWYPVLIALNLIALFYTGTRGTQIGLLAGGFATLGLIAWHERGRVRKVFAGVIIVTTILVASVFIFKESTLVQSSPTLARFASISPSDLTGMSRLSIWKISYDAWKERPLLGYGQENFSHIFAERFIPEKMWKLEAWYDRSHDVFFDWLVAAGAIGLLSYLSLYVMAFWLIWLRKNDVSLRERAILTGAFIGYFVHNVFVFDNLVSYIIFFLLLAYVAFRTGVRGESERSVILKEETIKSFLMPVVGICFLVFFYFLTYQPFMVNRMLVRGLDVNRALQIMSFVDVIKLQQESFIKAVKINTLGSEEAREQFYQTTLRMTQVTIPNDISDDEKRRAIDAISSLVNAAKQDIENSYEANKDNVRMLSIYGTFYNGLGDGVSAERMLARAHELAPKKQLISFDLMRAYLLQGKNAEAYSLGRETYDLAPEYQEAVKMHLLASVYANKWNEAKAYVISKGEEVPFDPDVLNALVSTKQISAAIEFLNELKKTNPEYASQVDAYVKELLAKPAK